MAGKANAVQETVPDVAKIARLMALNAIKEMANNIDKALFLRGVGFANPEIAAMLGISTNQVAVAFVQARKRRTKRKPRE